MEPAQTQLARATPAISKNGGTSNPSIHSDRLSLAYMSIWSTFQTDACRVFQQAGIAHEVPLNDETELYTVGNELGLTGRFVRNVCDPVIKALALVPGMASTRFADFQAISPPRKTTPDVCLGLVATSLRPGNVHLVGEIKTPWTIPDEDLYINGAESFHLEPLIGMPAQHSLTFTSSSLTLGPLLRTTCCSDAHMFDSVWIPVHLRLHRFC